MRRGMRARSPPEGIVVGDGLWTTPRAMVKGRGMSPNTPIASMAETLEEMGDEFDLLGDPTDPERYRHVIDLGRQLAPLSDDERTDANTVRACASQVWLVTERQGDRLWFRGDSDAHIVRGLIAIVLRLYSGRT